MPLLSVSSAKALENSGNMRFLVMLSAPATQDVTASYTASSDGVTKNPAGVTNFTAVADGLLSIAAGQTQGYIEVPILNDGVKTSDLNFNLALSNPVGASLAKLDKGSATTTTVTGTIADSTPTLSIAATKFTEGPTGTTQTARFLVTLSTPTTQDVTVHYKASSDGITKGPAVADTNFTAVENDLTIAAGQTQGYIEVPILGDGMKTGNLGFNLTLSSPVGAGLAKLDKGAATTTVAGTIIDYENTRPTLSVASSKTLESAGTMRFLVTLSAPTTQDVTVGYTASSDGVTKNPAGVTNLTAVTDGLLSIAAGQTQGYIEVPILNDGVKAGDLNFNLALSSPVGASLAKLDKGSTTTTTVTGTIADSAPTLSIAATKLTEGSAGTTQTARFLVTLSAPTTQDVTVHYKASSDGITKGPAVADTNFTAVEDDLTIAAGQTQGYIEVPILGDGVKTGNLGFNLTLSSPVGAGLAKLDKGAATTTVAGTIIDYESAKTPADTTVSLAPVKVAEDAGQAHFAVILSAPINSAMTFNYATADSTNGGAKAGVDYAKTTGSLTFEAGETIKYIDIGLVDDGQKEGEETFNLILSRPRDSGSAAGATLTSSATIVDNESVISIDTPKLAEGAEKMHFAVTLSAPSNQTVSVDYATIDSKAGGAKAGSDYAKATGSVTFEAGETIKYIDVDIIDDGLKENAESFDLTLTKPKGAGFAKGDSLSTSGAILDNDDLSAPTLSFAPATKASENAETMIFWISLSSPAAKPVSVAYTTADSKTGNVAKAGSDYEKTTGTLTFDAGETLKSIEVKITDDGQKESDEAFDLVLSNAWGAGLGTGSTLSTSATIVDNEGILSAAFASASEGAGQMFFAVTLSAPSEQAITIHYATADSKTGGAKAGSDYMKADGTLTFQPGDTLGYVTVDLIDDKVKEDNESFDLLLTSPDGAGFGSGNAIKVVGSIIDNEPTVLM